MTTDPRFAALRDAAVAEALDLLEQLVTSQWHYNDGTYQPFSELDAQIADVLAERRPGRWERTEGGLRRRPVEGPTPFEHRGDGGADIT